jgi:hypothetical protein
VDVGNAGIAILRATKQKGRKKTEAAAEADDTKKKGEDGIWM